jgi:hypothetical protein
MTKWKTAVLLAIFMGTGCTTVETKHCVKITKVICSDQDKTCELYFSDASEPMMLPEAWSGGLLGQEICYKESK